MAVHRGKRWIRFVTVGTLVAALLGIGYFAASATVGSAAPIPPAAPPLTVAVGSPTAPSTSNAPWTTGNVSLGAPGAYPIALAYVAATDDLWVEDVPSVLIEVSALTGARVATLEIGSAPAEANAPASLALDPASDRVYLLGPGPLGVTAVDWTTNTVVASFDLPSACQVVEGLAFVPSTAELWVACASAIVAISTVTGSVVYALAVAYAPGTILFDPASGAVVASVYVHGPSENGSATYGLDVFDPAVAPTLSETIVTGTGSSGAFVVGTGDYVKAMGELVFPAQGPTNSWGVEALSALDYHGAVFVPLPGHPVSAAAAGPNSSTVYLAMYGSESIARFDLRGLTVNASVPSGGTPVAVAVDPADASVWVADEDTAQLWGFAAATLQPIAQVAVGGGPGALAVDPATGRLWVANSNNVTVLSGSPPTILATIPIDGGPSAVAIDPVAGRAYVATVDNANVTIINASTFRIVGSIAVAAQPTALAVDPPLGLLLVASDSGRYGEVEAFSLSSGQPIARWTVGHYPTNLLLDPASGDVIVTNELSSNLTVIDPLEGPVAATVNLTGFYPWQAAYDARDRLLLLSDANEIVNVSSGGAYAWVYALNATTFAFVGRTMTDPVTLGLAYDPVNGLAYAAAYLTSRVVVLTPDPLAVIATIPVGLEPVPAIFDPTADAVVIGNSASASLTYIWTPVSEYALTVTETGLPTGTYWSASVGNESQRSNATAILFELANGTYPFAVGSVSGYVATPSEGNVTLDGAPAGLTIRFEPTGSAATFAVSPALIATTGGVATGAVAALVAYWVDPRRRVRRPPDRHSPL